MGSKRRAGHRRPIGLLCALFLAACTLASCGGEPSPVPEDRPPAPSPAETGDGPALTYTLSFEAAHQHYVRVEARFDRDLADAEGRLELMMATWTPGSYLIREYSRHVEGLVAHAEDRRPLPVVKSAKNRWIVQASGARTIHVGYRLYAREMTVRTNFVDADMAVLNGAPTFVLPVGAQVEPGEVHLRLPEGWSESATALRRLAESSPLASGASASGSLASETASDAGEGAAGGDAIHAYAFPDYDTLVDSPILVGNLEIARFELDGVDHYLVNQGDVGFVDLERQLEDVRVLTRAQVDFWGHVPYEHYWFLNVVAEAGGGLEHRDSTLMMTSRWRIGDPDSYPGWLGLVSHELFHAWNVKRLRPLSLGPFDYENERYTRSLWVAEGLTSYYTPLLLRRAGLIDDEAYLERLSATVRSVETKPGRRVRSVAESSFDAWIKHYRPDENSGNTAISYYSKGQLVGFLFDAEIRRQTNDRKSLDDVMRAAYERYSGERGFTPGEFRQVVVDIAGEETKELFERFVDGTDELDYANALDWYGLRFLPIEGKGEISDDGDGASPRGVGWLGFRPENATERLVVAAVPRDTPSWQYGLNVEDEILAIDGYRVMADDFERRLEFFPPGQEVDVLISRRGALRTLRMVLGAEPETSFEIEVDPEASSDREARRRAWLDGS